MGDKTNKISETLVKKAETKVKPRIKQPIENSLIYKVAENFFNAPQPSYRDDIILKALPKGVEVWGSYLKPEEPAFKNMYSNRSGDKNKYRKAMGAYFAARTASPKLAKRYAVWNEVQDFVTKPTKDHWLGASRADLKNVDLGIEAHNKNMSLIQLLDHVEAKGTDRPK